MRYFIVVRNVISCLVVPVGSAAPRASSINSLIVVYCLFLDSNCC